MDRSTSRFLVAAAAVAVAVVGAGIGAGVYATVSPSNGTTTTVVNSVTTVDHTQQIAATSGLTVTEIYQRTRPGRRGHQGQGATRASPSAAAAGQSDEGRGLRLRLRRRRPRRHELHVVEGATSVHVRFSNGRRRRDVVGTDTSTDLAVLEVDAPASELHPLALADSDAVAGRRRRRRDREPVRARRAR